jgi:hypothetical protein
MDDRLHLILPRAEKERYRALAEAEGMTLSDWVREAVRESAARYETRPRLDTPEALQTFFDALDRASPRSDGREPPREPDWDEYRILLAEGKKGGQAAP